MEWVHVVDTQDIKQGKMTLAEVGRKKVTLPMLRANSTHSMIGAHI
jgi:hypothetical protein